MNSMATLRRCLRSAPIKPLRKRTNEAGALSVFGDVREACGAVAGKDPVIAAALEAIGAPYIRQRPGGFEGLFRIITEQQVSVPSAAAVWARCREGLPSLSPAAAIEAGEDALRGYGLTRPKARYVLALAKAVSSGALDPQALPTLDDDAAREALIAVKGIGPWTAAIYLLFCEGRIDIWPPGDVALLSAFNRAKARGPSVDLAGLEKRSLRWRPHRGLAAHILWTFHAYSRGRKPS